MMDTSSFTCLGPSEVHKSGDAWRIGEWPGKAIVVVEEVVPVLVGEVADTVGGGGGRVKTMVEERGRRGGEDTESGSGGSGSAASKADEILTMVIAD